MNLLSEMISSQPCPSPNSNTHHHVLLILFPKVAGQDGEQDGSAGACGDAHFQPEIDSLADGDSLLRQRVAAHA